jgi:signal peptidase I
MAPLLRDGQLVLTIRCRPGRRLRRGTVVAVDSRELGRRIVKRVVGLPGEHLRLEGTRLWVDGRPQAEPYAAPSGFRGTFDVPEGHHLLLGDDRGASTDARTWRNPYVARAEIVGVLLVRHRRTRPPAQEVTGAAPSGGRPRSLTGRGV